MKRHHKPLSTKSRRIVASLRRRDDPDINVLKEVLMERDKQVKKLEQEIDKLKTQHEDMKAEAEALRQVSEATGSAFQLEDMLRAAADIALQITDTESCQIYLYDSTQQELALRSTDSASTHLIGSIRLKLGEGISGWVARERKPVQIAHRSWEDHRFKFFSALQEDKYESLLSVPLLSRGEIVGVINVRTKLPRDYTRKQVRMLSGIANQLAGAIQRNHRYKALERQAVQLRTLSEVSEAITSNMYLEELLHLFVTMTAETMGYKICTVMLLSRETNELIIKATQTENDEYRQKPNLKIGESIAGRATSEKRVITVPDVQMADEYLFPDIAQKAGIRSMASVPLMMKGEVLGVLNCYTEVIHEFTEAELVILQTLAAQAALAIEHSKLMVKSAVIQEMHHRISNNLQQIVSLVRLEMRYGKYKDVEAALNDTLNRILAISSVHELLTRGDLDEVSVKKLAENILTATQQSVIPPDKSIRTSITGDDFTLPPDQATSIALTLNELIQNAVEHGFQTLNDGRIHIQLEQNDEGYRIAVLNDGEQLPPDFKPEQRNSLGLSIVKTLVRNNLKGTFSLENAVYDPGIIAIVRFPIRG